MDRSDELELLRRSVATLAPGARALRREEALRLLGELGEVEQRLAPAAARAPAVGRGVRRPGHQMTGGVTVGVLTEATLGPRLVPLALRRTGRNGDAQGG